jgi:putative oxidoreductase
MSIFEASPSPWTGRMLAVLRIITGLSFITAGTTKLFGWPPPPMPMPPLELMSQIGIGAIMEVVGGALFTIGLFTRPVAFILSGEMAVAYWQFHAPAAFFPTTNNGVGAMLYCFIFLYFVFSGAGPWSVDTLIARRRRVDTAFSGAVGS